MENKIYKLSDAEFINLVKSSLNVSEVLFKLGYPVKGNSWGFSEIKERMLNLNLTGYDFKGKSTIKQDYKKIKPEKLFCEHSKHNRTVLRKYIIRNKLLPYTCAICGVKEWNGKTLSLELDHINGINDDNRIENLRFLCPNCHSQTDTYGVKTSKLTESHYDISNKLHEKIYNTYLDLKSINKVSHKLGISLKAVKQSLNETGLTKSKQRYVIQYDNNYNELQRFGSIAECCRWLMDNNVVKTKLMKTCRNTLLRNINSYWNNYYFEILDA